MSEILFEAWSAPWYRNRHYHFCSESCRDFFFF